MLLQCWMQARSCLSSHVAPLVFCLPSGAASSSCCGVFALRGDACNFLAGFLITVPLRSPLADMQRMVECRLVYAEAMVSRDSCRQMVCQLQVLEAVRSLYSCKGWAMCCSG